MFPHAPLAHFTSKDCAAKLAFELIQKIVLVREMSENKSAIIITPGYLETSEETVSMEPFKKHPKGLAYDKQM